MSKMKGCGKEQEAGSETYVCGEPNSRTGEHGWYCRKCKNKYISHLESENDALKAQIVGMGSEPVTESGAAV